MAKKTSNIYTLRPRQNPSPSPKPPIHHQSLSPPISTMHLTTPLLSLLTLATTITAIPHPSPQPPKFSCAAKPWPLTPPLLICDGHGTLSHPAYLDAPYNTTVMGCASDCLNNLRCLTLEYNNGESDLLSFPLLLLSLRLLQTKADRI